MNILFSLQLGCGIMGVPARCVGVTLALTCLCDFVSSGKLLVAMISTVTVLLKEFLTR